MNEKLSSETHPGNEEVSDVNERLETWLNEPEGEAAEEQTEAIPDVEESEEDPPAEEEAENSESNESEEDSETETLTLDGEEVTLPKDVAEKVTKIQKRLEADYTRKTQEASEMRKAASAKEEEVNQWVAFQSESIDYLADLKAAQNALKGYDDVDWGALAEADIGTYSKHKEVRDALREKVSLLNVELSQRHAFAQQKDEQERLLKMQSTVETVKRAIPDYFEKYDTKVISVAQALASKYGLKIDNEELRRLSNDPLVVFGLVELSKYQDLVAKRPASAQKVAAAPSKPSAKPHKSSTQSRDQKIRSLLNQGRIREAAEI